MNRRSNAQPSMRKLLNKMLISQKANNHRIGALEQTVAKQEEEIKQFRQQQSQPASIPKPATSLQQSTSSDAAQPSPSTVADDTQTTDDKNVQTTPRNYYLPEHPQRTLHDQALDGAYYRIQFMSTTQHLTLQPFFDELLPLMLETADLLDRPDAQLKINPVLVLSMTRTVNNESKQDHIYLPLKAAPLNRKFVENLLPEFEKRLENFTQNGSGLVLESVTALDWQLVMYQDIAFLKGHGKATLPEKLAKKKAVVNVEVTDDRCFLYAVLAALHYKDVTANRNRASKYSQWINDINVDGISFPFTVSQIKTFERLNPTLAVSLLRWRDDRVHRLISPKQCEGRQIVSILLVNDHYVAVTDLDRLLHDSDGGHGHHKRFYCDRCLRPFLSLDKLAEHKPLCVGDGKFQAIQMPKEKEYSFKSWGKTLSPPQVIYADIECILKKGNESELQDHKPYAVAYLVTPNAAMDELKPRYHCYVGFDAMEHFLKTMEEETERITKENDEHAKKKMKKLTMEQRMNFQQATTCYMCHKAFPEGKKVREHCHLTGDYRGASCVSCNAYARLRRNKIPIIFHNFRGYDAHFVVQALPSRPEWTPGVIATSSESYLSLSASWTKLKRTYHVQFIDSMRFLTSSLAKLAKNCPCLPLTDTLPFPPSITRSKGVFPYSFFDGKEKLDITALPSREDFYDTLNRCHVSEQDYQHALNSWSLMGSKNFGDYMLNYLQLDVYLLADVFEEFRRMSLEQDGLDPVNYVSLPGLSWDSAFKMTETEVHLLTEEDQYEFFERGIRGGCTFVNKHHLQRNSPDDEDYDPNQPHNELLYIDANNLYGNALSKQLPQSDFEWVKDPVEMERLIQELPEMNINGTFGFTAEVDLEIPKELHDLTDDFPLAPEKGKAKCEWLTEYMEGMLDGHRFAATKKLLLTHLPKERYVVHFALLQFYMKMGVVVTMVHRIIKYRQASFFEPYISFNSNKRQQASTDFVKDFYKLKNNALFGKTMENVRERMDMRLCNTKKRLITYTSKPLYQRSLYFSESLVGVQLLKDHVKLDKPIYIGQAVLDLSKLEMYQLRYEKLVQYETEFGGRIRTAGGDTDSFFLEVSGISLTKQLLPAMARDELLDTSNYPKDHPLFSNKRKARLGCVKDEGEGEVFKEWVLLRPKCYSMLTVDQHEKMKKAKGVQQSVVANSIHHEDYVKVYDECKIDIREVRRIASKKHKVRTVAQHKKALGLWEDKRAWTAKNDSVAYGHHSLPSPTVSHRSSGALIPMPPQ